MNVSQKKVSVARHSYCKKLLVHHISYFINWILTELTKQRASSMSDLYWINENDEEQKKYSFVFRYGWYELDIQYILFEHNWLKDKPNRQHLSRKRNE